MLRICIYTCLVNCCYYCKTYITKACPAKAHCNSTHTGTYSTLTVTRTALNRLGGVIAEHTHESQVVSIVLYCSEVSPVPLCLRGVLVL